MTDQEILTIVNNEYKQSYDAISQKKLRMQERLKYFMNTEKNDEKVSLYMIRWYVNTLIALYYQDWLSQTFYSRDIYSYLEAENLNVIASADYNLMKMDVSDYMIQWNRFVYWLWIRVFTWRDDKLQKPNFEIIHPLDIYPDPKWHSEINNFRFFWFERNTTLQELREMWYKNIDQLQAWLSSDMEDNRNYLWQNKEIYQTQREHTRIAKQNYKKDWTITIYYHYTMIDWKPHQIVCWNKTLILSNEVIKPLADDKYAWTMLKFPVILNYYEPYVWDPFWNSLFDVLEDKQRTKTLFVNLMRIRAIRVSLWWQMFLDKTIFKENKRQLANPTIWRMYLPFDSNNWPINQAVYQVPENPISSDVYNLRDIMDNEAENDTWIWNNIRWLWSDWNETATEVKNKQMNANVNLVLWNKINSRWERDFWTCRYYRYKYYFRWKKQIHQSRWLVRIWKVFERKDILSWIDPHIEINNKWEQELKRKEESQQYLNMMRSRLQQPDLLPVSRRFIQRKWMRLQWMTAQEIEIAIPYTPAEMEAKQQVLLLNRNIPVEVGDMSEDHYTYIVIYESALDTPAKFTSIEARKQAYVLSWQSQQDFYNTKENNQWWWTANQMANFEMQRQQSKSPSLENLQ